MLQALQEFVLVCEEELGLITERKQELTASGKGNEGRENPSSRLLWRSFQVLVE